MDSSRVARVLREMASSSSSASRVYQPLATAATRLIWALLRASSVARYCARACSFRAATRPKKSISQADTARPTWKALAYWPLVLGWRVPEATPFTTGYWLARVIWNWARACSMLSTDTRRSRLFSSAMVISCCRRGSEK